MRRVRVPRELDDFTLLQAKRLLEPLSDLHERVSTFVRAATFSTRNIAITTARERLSDALCPQADTIETLAHVDHDAHDFTVVFVFERFADGSEHYMQPEVVDGDALLVLELECPLAAMLVLGIFPLRLDVFLEEVVV